MEARAIGDIMQVSANRRAEVLSEGMDLLVEHARELQAGSSRLHDEAHERGAAVLDLVRGEEAAKVLILVDAMRLGWRDNAAASRHLRHFSDHVARGIYCEIAGMSPATFGEVRYLVDSLRRSHYLDGPNDVDWTFRNQIEANREETLYVDYVKDEEGHRWVSPSGRYATSARSAAVATDLVMALHRLGVLSAPGLKLVLEAWDGVELTDDYHWQDHLERVEAVLGAIEQAGLVTECATDHDIRVVYDRWTFPLGVLDLSKRQVPTSELEKERRQVMERIWVDLYGAPDYGVYDY